MNNWEKITTDHAKFSDTQNKFLCCGIIKGFHDCDCEYCDNKGEINETCYQECYKINENWYCPYHGLRKIDE